MGKYDDQQIDFIGGEEVSWPEGLGPGTGCVWNHMRRAVKGLRDTVRDSDARLAAVEENRDLSPEGRTRQLRDIGLGVLRKVGEHAALSAARRYAGEHIERLDTQMQAHAKPPEAAADIALATEIRAALRGMTAGERMRFVTNNLDRPGFAGAVSGDAAYLAGLSDTEAGEIRNMVAVKFYAPQLDEKEKLQAALRHLDAAVIRASNLVAGRAKVTRNVHGEWPTQAPTGSRAGSPIAA